MKWTCDGCRRKHPRRSPDVPCPLCTGWTTEERATRLLSIRPTKKILK